MVVAAALTGVFVVRSERTTSDGVTGTRTPTSSAPPPSAAGHPTTTVPALEPLRVRSITPAPAATHVATSSLIRITFSVPPAATSARPTLTPAVAGHWSLDGNSWTFSPSGGYIPQSTETVSVPAATSATEEGRRVHLAAAYKSTFTVRSGSTLRLQQILAELQYLPFTFTRAVAPPAKAPALATVAAVKPAGESRAVGDVARSKASEVTARGAALKAEPTVAGAVPLSPQDGRLSWSYSDIPASLSAMWSPGHAGVLTSGAVMAFEADHDLAVDGIAGPQVWTAIAHAVAARQVDPRPYNYIEVSESEPQGLTVWQNGHTVYSSPVNTGVEGARTATGTFPVYLRYAVHGMIGTNPDGTKYNDPAIPWIAYFNGGDAIHGYPRSSYGFPQSNGCVELPIDNAGTMFNSGMDSYGTLVHVA